MEIKNGPELTEIGRFEVGHPKKSEKKENGKSEQKI